jgi:hypothetical protein
MQTNCWAPGSIQGQNRGTRLLWEWTKEVLTTEDISNKFLFAKDDSEGTAWHVAAKKGNTEL